MASLLMRATILDQLPIAMCGIIHNLACERATASIDW